MTAPAGSIRVFVDGRSVVVPAGSTALAAVRAADAALAGVLASAGATVTDARGIALEPSAALAAGAILRVVVSARRRGEGGDAHA